MRIMLCLIFTMFINPACAQEFIFFSESQTPDLYSSFNCVLRLLLYYEKGYCAGVEVDFQKNGAFYEASRGPNWWQYYFEPILVGNPDNGIPIPCGERRANEVTQRIAEDCTREGFYKMIRKYIRAKPQVRQKVQQFYNKSLKGHTVIGLHYMAHTKKTPRIEFDRLSEEVHRYIKENKVKDYRLFVSTDDQSFLDMMRMLFPDRVFFLPGLRVKGKAPVSIKTPYQHGEREILECLLLSKTDVLIHTPSYLSEWAQCYNISLPAVKIEGRRQPNY